ncbi:MAG TPA: FAD:protein FMN transferase [Mycobacteriales bacterium]|jgi:thiamine biosynthesis lipoprotein|nr:FAD:protein FMN transferase [Mycobacteriales bacterium]
MTAIAAPVRRTMHVEHCMGTVFTIDVRDHGDWSEPIAQAIAFLHHIDGVLSTFRADSDISRINRGELTVDRADPLVAEVLDRSVEMQRATDGWFSPLWDGRLDPTGLVKGWAVEQVCHMLRLQGSSNHAVNGGGDVQLAGEAGAGQPWRVGIADPFQPGHTIATIAGRDFAVATSGTAERGRHIRNPFTGTVADSLTAVTVVGRSLTAADCYATAAVAMGGAAAEWLERLPGHEALIVANDRTLAETTNFARLW